MVVCGSVAQSTNREARGYEPDDFSFSFERFIILQRYAKLKAHIYRVLNTVQKSVYGLVFRPPISGIRESYGPLAHSAIFGTYTVKESIFFFPVFFLLHLLLVVILLLLLLLLPWKICDFGTSKGSKSRG